MPLRTSVMVAVAAVVWAAATATALAAGLGLQPAGGAATASLLDPESGTIALADGYAYAGEVDDFSAPGRELLHGCHYRRCAPGLPATMISGETHPRRSSQKLGSCGESWCSTIPHGQVPRFVTLRHAYATSEIWPDDPTRVRACACKRALTGAFK